MQVHVPHKAIEQPYTTHHGLGLGSRQGMPAPAAAPPPAALGVSRWVGRGGWWHLALHAAAA